MSKLTIHHCLIEKQYPLKLFINLGLIINKQLLNIVLDRSFKLSVNLSICFTVMYHIWMDTSVTFNSKGNQ